MTLAWRDRRPNGRGSGAKQIYPQLAEKHYWALANAAGVVAGQLEEFLVERTYHLVIRWEDRASLAARLDEIAEDSASASFPHFCRLIWLFDAFQFQGSMTYLLTDHAAGDHCKRLYNMFVASLPSQLQLATIRELTINVDKGGRKVKRKLRDLPSGELTEAMIHKRLKSESGAYADWFKGNVPAVGVAAHALRAYSELLNHELAVLYRLWFKHKQPSPEAYGVEQSLGAWPGVLTRESADTIRAASFHSELLQPLGAALKLPAPPPATPAPTGGVPSTAGIPASQSATPPSPAGGRAPAPAPAIGDRGST